MIDRFGPGVGHLNFLAVPGIGISEFLFVHDHKSFLGVGNLVIFDLTFLPGGREFDSNLLKNVKIPPYAPPPPPPAGLALIGALCWRYILLMRNGNHALERTIADRFPELPGSD